MSGLVYRRIFEDWETLDECLSCDRLPSVLSIARRVFILERQADTTRPDHFYKGYIDKRLRNVDGHCGLLLTVLEDLAHAYLSVRAGKIFVRRELLGEWQHLLPFISPLLIMAARLQSAQDWTETLRTDNQVRARVMGAGFKHTALPTVWDPQLDEFICREGLNEMHLHLNGSTELDKVWLAALRHPDGFFREIRKANGAEAACELYEQIRPGLNAYKLYRYLRIARRLRALLTIAAFPYPNAPAINLSDVRQAITNRKSSALAEPFWSEHGGLPLHKLHPTLVKGLTGLQAEAVWYVGVIRLLREQPTPAHGLMFHAYLLILGMFGRLTVQQTNQLGFDQFQKFTLNGLRENAEKTYADRFHQLNGPDGNDLDHLEGRFAPKKKRRQTLHLLNTIRAGYKRFNIENAQIRRASRTMSLGLVTHFIKERDAAIEDAIRRNSGTRRITPVRYFDLRRRIERQGRDLLTITKYMPSIRDLLTGIDAAANESHTPPEPFGPVFRMMRRGGWVHATYHVGEDFEHLLSGIRAVVEAIEFLGLQSGDRIGHAIALGIDPRRWLRYLGSRIMLRVQDHLDNLVFAHEWLAASHSEIARSLVSTIHRLSYQMYRTAPPPHLLYMAWQLRRLDPVMARYVNRCLSMLSPEIDLEVAERMIVHRITDPHRRAEAQEALNAARELPDAFALFIDYHRPDVHQRGMAWSEVDLAEVDTDALIALQHRAIDLLNRRNIAIETLPTSNVRISYYEDHEDHHVLRWLGRHPDFPTGAPRPIVCVGSDDPGIFACSLRNEYAHLKRILQDKLHLSGDDAMAILQQLNTNGRAFRFRWRPNLN